MNLNELKSICENLLPSFIKAGNEAKKIAREGIKVTIKKDNTPVTNADIIVDKILQNEIKKITPSVPIISEETIDFSNEKKLKTFWLIDPIDGTKDYIKNKDEYTLNAALVINNETSLGIISAPMKKRLFYSYGKNQCYELIDNKKKNLSCKKQTKKGEIFALSHSNDPTEDILKIFKENKVKKITKMSSSYKFCVIAAGEFDIYACRSRAFEWDIAAGHAIVEHAGGIVVDHSGNSVSYGKKDYKNPDLIIKRSNNLAF